MVIYTIGAVVIAAVLAVGVFWLFSNITVKQNTNKDDTKDSTDA